MPFLHSWPLCQIKAKDSVCNPQPVKMTMSAMVYFSPARQGDSCNRASRAEYRRLISSVNLWIPQLERMGMESRKSRACPVHCHANFG